MLGCSQIRKQRVLFLKKDSNTGGEDTVLPASVANWVLNNLIAGRRFRPTRVEAQDLSEQLHLAVILTPSLPYFLSLYLHSLPHLRREHKGAKSLRRISIATVSRPFKNTCSGGDADQGSAPPPPTSRLMAPRFKYLTRSACVQVSTPFPRLFIPVKLTGIRQSCSSQSKPEDF